MYIIFRNKHIFIYNIFAATCVYVFRAGLFILNNQLVCFYLGKTISLTVSIPQFSAVLCVRLRPKGLSPVNQITVLWGPL